MLRYRRIHQLGTRVFFLATILALCGRASAATVFCHFTTADSSYANDEVAAAIAELSQLAVQDLANVEWVERGQIKRLLNELELSETGASAPLQLGKLLKADLMIKGTFSTDLKKAWRFELEVIDMEHADVLIRQGGAVNRQTGPGLTVTDALVSRIEEGIRGLLPEAIRRREGMSQRVLVAALHFQNTHANKRLDFVENELQLEFNKRNSEQATHRYLQFPRVYDAISESTLATSGLVELRSSDGNRMADCYVWGTYHESIGSDVPFEEVPIQFRIQCWDGTETQSEKTFDGLMRDREQLFKQIISYVESVAVKRRKEPIAHETRQKIAERFYQRAISRQRQTLQVAMKDASHPTATWLRLYVQTRRLLAVAVFFDPANEVIRREFFVESIRDDLFVRDIHGTTSLDWLLLRNAAWLEYAMMFGLDYSMPHIYRFPGHQGSLGCNRLAHSHFEVAHLKSTEDLLRYIHQEIVAVAQGSRRNTDIPIHVLRRWRSTLSDQFISQARILAEKDSKQIKVGWGRIVKSVEYLGAPQVQAEFLDIVWPMAARSPWFKGRGIRPMIEKIYDDLGKSELAVSMLKAVGKEPPLMPRPKPKSEASGPFYKLDLTPVAKTVRVPLNPYTVKEWWHTQLVTALSFAEGRLWCGFTGQKIDRNVTPGNGLFTWDTTAGKWQTWGKLNRRGSVVKDIQEIDGDLWVAFQGDNICRMNLATGRTQRFRPENGAPDGGVSDICRIDSTVYVGGGNAGHGFLTSYDLKRREWTEHDLGTADASGATVTPSHVHSIVANSNWVATFAGAGHLLLTGRAGNEGRINVNTTLQLTHSEFSHFKSRWQPRIRALAFHNDLLWIPTSRGPIVYDPTRNAVVYSERIPYELTSMLIDGDQLWFGASPFQGNGTLGDTDEMTCLLLMDMKTRKWLAQIPIPYKGHIDRVCRQGDTLWLAPGQGDATVVAADISMFRKSAD